MCQKWASKGGTCWRIEMFSGLPQDMPFHSSQWASPEVKRCTNTRSDTTPHDDPRSPQANLRRYEAALGKVEGQVCSEEEDQNPSCNERGRQKEVVSTDESPMGCEEKGEGIAQSLNVAVRRLVYFCFPSLDEHSKPEASCWEI